MLEVSLQQGSVLPHKGSWLLEVKMCEYLYRQVKKDLTEDM